MLTKSQQTAIGKIENFLCSDKDVFILKGYAGTGKTFLIREILSLVSWSNAELEKINQGKFSELDKLEDKRSFHVAAPTGRAARVIFQKNDIPAVTIHKLIYDFASFRYDEENEENSVWTFGLRVNGDSLNALYIIDEASMIGDRASEEKQHLIFGSEKLLSDFIAYVSDFKGKPHNPLGGRKIIFIGDPAQLPPITQSFSPALSAEYLKEKFNLESEEYTLTEIVRQKADSKPLQVSQRIRRSIDNNTFNEFSLKNDAEKLNNINEVVEKFNFNNNEKIITYSNKLALDYNLLLRKKKLYVEKIREHGEVLNGEELIVVQNNYLYEIYNGEFVKVVSASHKVERQVVHLRGREKETVLTFRDAEIEYVDMSGEKKRTKLKLFDNLLWSPERGITADEAVALLVFVAARLGLKRPKKPRKPKDGFFTSEENERYNREMLKYSEELQKYVEAIRTDPYFSSLHVKFGYAITCHKAQGGEWDNIFIDFTGFTSYTHKLFFRWAYTAVTRASKKLYSVNAPEFKPWTAIEPISEEEQGTLNSEKFTDAPEEIEIPEDIKGITPRNIYKAVARALSGSEIKIINYQNFPWKERFTLLCEGKSVRIDFNYSSKGKVKQSYVGKTDDNVKEIIDARLSKIIAVDNTEESIDFGEFPEEFLEKFYHLLEGAFSQYNIKISQIIHGNFMEKYRFTKGSDFCAIIFYYTGKKTFSKSEPKIEGHSTEEFKNLCINIINKAKTL